MFFVSGICKWFYSSVPPSGRSIPRKQQVSFLVDSFKLIRLAIEKMADILKSLLKFDAIFL